MKTIPKIKCKCGCEKILEKYDSRGRRRKYICGHNITSSLGHKIKTSEEAIKSNIKINENGCWVWQGYKKNSGHGNMTFKNKRYNAHRFSYIVFKGKIENGKQVNHKCNNSSCVNPEHLYLGTQLDNIKDAVNAGNMHYNRVINEDTIIKIRKLYSTNKYTQRELGIMFDISNSHIGDIVNFSVRR